MLKTHDRDGARGNRAAGADGSYLALGWHEVGGGRGGECGGGDGEGQAPAHLQVVAAIAAGGALGGLVRAGAVKLAPLHEGSWPWATFCVNIAGCLILGFAVTLLFGRRRPRSWRSHSSVSASAVR